MGLRRRDRFRTTRAEKARLRSRNAVWSVVLSVAWLGAFKAAVVFAREEGFVLRHTRIVLAEPRGTPVLVEEHRGPRRTVPLSPDELDFELVGPPDGKELGPNDTLEVAARFTNLSDRTIVIVEPWYREEIARFRWLLFDAEDHFVPPSRQYLRCGAPGPALEHRRFLAVQPGETLVVPVPPSWFGAYDLAPGELYGAKLEYELRADPDEVNERGCYGPTDEPGTRERLAKAFSLKIRSKNAIVIGRR